MAEKYIIFVISGRKYGIKLAKVNGLEPLYDVTPVPLAQKNIMGIIHLRGQIVPVYDLKSHFALKDNGRISTSQMLISEVRGLKLGFEVDDVLCIATIFDDDMKHLPNVALNKETSFVERAINVRLPEQKNAELLLSINVDGLMSDEDFAAVKAFVDEASAEEAAENEAGDETTDAKDIDEDDEKE